MPVLTKDAILNSPLATKAVPVPQWGGDVIVGELSWANRQNMLRLVDEYSNDPAQLELELFLVGVVEPKFEADDLIALREKSGTAIGDVSMEVLRINGMLPDALREARGEF